MTNCKHCGKDDHGKFIEKDGKHFCCEKCHEASKKPKVCEFC